MHPFNFEKTVILTSNYFRKYKKLKHYLSFPPLIILEWKNTTTKHLQPLAPNPNIWEEWEGIKCSNLSYNLKKFAPSKLKKKC